MVDFDSELFRDDDESDDGEHDDDLLKGVSEEQVKAIKKLLSDDDDEKYKGIQRVVSSKDKEIQELRESLSEAQGSDQELKRVIEDLQADQEDMIKVFENAMDDEAREEFRKAREKAKQESSLERRLQKIEEGNQSQEGQDSNGNSGSQQNVSEEQQAALDKWLEQMRNEATDTLTELSSKLGLKPEDVDIGDAEEALLVRVQKFLKSIDTVSEEDLSRIKSVRKGSSQGGSETRTDNSGGRSVPEGSARTRLGSALREALNKS